MFLAEQGALVLEEIRGLQDPRRSEALLKRLAEGSRQGAAVRRGRGRVGSLHRQGQGESEERKGHGLVP